MPSLKRHLEPIASICWIGDAFTNEHHRKDLHRNNSASQSNRLYTCDRSSASFSYSSGRSKQSMSTLRQPAETIFEHSRTSRTAPCDAGTGQETQCRCCIRVPPTFHHYTSCCGHRSPFYRVQLGHR
ncbi:hypothetical protein BV20DRAFT_638102 [Pilatotrama ljubarskyi]|nr:hypothetical protein BV20DRAFT_638102 [Pilatotrama ljubarskyi]